MSSPSAPSDDPARGTDRLMFLTPSLDAGGAEQVLVQLANGASGSVDVTLVSLTGGTALRDRVAPAVHLLDLGRGRVRAAALPLVRLIRASHPDVVIASQAHVNILLGLLRPFLPSTVRTVVREADLRTGRSVSHRATRLAQRTIYRGHALVLATSSWMAEDLARRRGGPIAVLPNPVDEDGLRRRAGHAPASTSAGHRLVHVGRLVPGKRIADLVSAFHVGAGPEDTLVLVGEGPERAPLEQQVRRLGIEARVTFAGFDPHPERHLAHADALVLTSASEGMPNVVLEALAVGTPVLATDELVTLRGLSATVPYGALRLIPRDDLARALGELPTVVRTPTDPLPASLLPPEHRLPAVTGLLLSLVRRTGSRPVGPPAGPDRGRPQA